MQASNAHLPDHDLGLPVRHPQGNQDLHFHVNASASESNINNTLKSNRTTEQRNAEARSFLWHPPQSHCSLVRSALSETSVDIRISMDICDLTFKPSKQSIISIINYSDIFRLFKAAALHPACFFCCKSCSSKRFSTLWSSKRACWHSSAQLGPQASWQHENGLRKSWSLLDWQKLKCWKRVVFVCWNIMNILWTS